jgi:hypothetical protein
VLVGRRAGRVSVDRRARRLGRALTHGEARTDVRHERVVAFAVRNSAGGASQLGGSAHQFAGHLSTDPVALMASLRKPRTQRPSPLQTRQMAGVSRVMIVDSDAVANRSRERSKQMTFRSNEPSASRRKPMGTLTRRAMLKGTVALAGLTAVHAAGLDPAVAAAPAGTSSGQPKANVLLVHGAWVDGSIWNRVIPILQQHGHNVVAVQLPLTSLAEDVAWTRHVLAERLQGPTVLAGQSYGGDLRRRHWRRQRDQPGVRRRLRARRG